MLKQAWHGIQKVALLLGLFLLFIVAIELFRVFVFFYRLNRVLAIGYVAVLLLFAVVLLVQWHRRPRVMTPPELPDDLGEASHRELQRYCRYLARYARRLASNPSLDEELQQAAADCALDIDDALSSHPLRDDLVREIAHAEEEVLAPILGNLREQASAEVRHSVRDVMLGVTLSPYHSVDILVVLYRNARMVLRISRIFNSRPQGREEWLILRDTFRVVATVNLLNLGKTLIESLFVKVPVIGRAVDDIGQGLGAGLLTSASGHAAIDRCAAFRRWDQQEAATSLLGQARSFIVDVRDLFTKDVLPGLKGRIEATTPDEAVRQPGFWDSISRGIATSLDATARTLDSFVVKPAVAGGKGVATAGTVVTRHVARAGGTVARATAQTSRHTYRGLGRVLHTFGQRVKYTFGSRKFRS